MSPTTKKIFAVAAVCALAALSARAESPAEKGIHLSEWGTETALPEYESPAPAALKAENDDAPDFGEFLAEEWNTFGAGALDPERLRKMMANRAVGQEDDSLMSFMASRWESAPGRLANFLTGYGEARLNALPGVENARLGLTPGGDNGFGFSASGVGMLHRSANSGFGLQPTVEKSATDGNFFGSFGAFQRWALGNWAVAGLNIFADYADSPDKGAASRYRVGADFSSAWVDADIRRFIGGEGERRRTADGRLFQAYAPHGTAAELRVHSPNLLWLEGFAKFSELEGRGGKADQRAHAFGVTYRPSAGPLAGLRANAQTADDGAKMDFSYSWVIGQGANTPGAAEAFNVYSDIADAVADGSFDPQHFEIYEGLHLYELQQNVGTVGITLSAAQLSMAIASMWDKIPPYLRISEEHRGSCPPPVFSIDEHYSALLNQHWSVLRASIEADIPYSETIRAKYQKIYGDDVTEEQAEAIYERHILDNWTALLSHDAVVGEVGICAALLSGAANAESSRRNLHPIFDAVSDAHNEITKPPKQSSEERRKSESDRNKILDRLRWYILAGFDVNQPVYDDAYDDFTVTSAFTTNRTPLDEAQDLMGPYYSTTTISFSWSEQESPVNRIYVGVEVSQRTSFMTDVLQMLVDNGAKCIVEGGQICALAHSDWSSAESPLSTLRAEPNAGAVTLESDYTVAPGSRGAIVTITAITDYVDVNYSLDGPVNENGALFAIANNGGFTDHSGSNGAGMLRINEKEIITDENGRNVTIYRSKEGVVTALQRLAEGTYPLTIRATFFYHTNIRNAVTSVINVNAAYTYDLGIEETYLTGEDGKSAQSERNMLAAFGLTRPQVTRLSGDDRIDYEGSSRLFRFNGADRPLEVGRTITANFRAMNRRGGGKLILVTIKIANPDLDDAVWVRKNISDYDCLSPARDGDDSTQDTLSSGRQQDGYNTRLHTLLKNNSTDYRSICDSLSKGADANYAPAGEATPLNLAIAAGNLTVQRILLANGADPEASDPIHGYPLHVAATVANTSIGKFLLERKRVGVNPARSDGQTPLHVLASRPKAAADSAGDADLEFAKLLAANNVAVNLTTNTGWGYLHFVAKSDNAKSMLPFLPLNISAHIETNRGRRLPLHMATESGNHAAMEEMLRNSRALSPNASHALNLNVNEVEPTTGRAAIHYAKTMKALDILMCAGADINARVSASRGVDLSAHTLAEILGDSHALSYDIDWWIEVMNEPDEIAIYCEDNEYPTIYRQQSMMASR